MSHIEHMSHVRWDIESFTKLLWNKPWEKPFGADWVKVKIIIVIIILDDHDNHHDHHDHLDLDHDRHPHHDHHEQAHENGSRVHVAEARHATTAITEEAIAVMENHKVMMMMMMMILKMMKTTIMLKIMILRILGEG